MRLVRARVATASLPPLPEADERNALASAYEGVCNICNICNTQFLQASCHRRGSMGVYDKKKLHALTARI